MPLRRVPLILLLALVLSAQQARTPAPKAPAGPPQTAATARGLLSGMSLRDKVAQLVIGVANGDVYARNSNEYKKVSHWVSDLRIGGLIVNNEVEFGTARNANPHAMAVFLNQMQRLARVPLIVGSDFERGASMRVTGGTQFPHLMAFGAAGDFDASRYEGLITAREARALGVHWVFAPVADVNNNPKNPVINIRSYGEDPDVVSQHVAAFIKGAHEDPETRVLVTAKHFPGHGDTDVDSHLGLPRLPITRERMDAMELKPFRAAIAQGVDSIMTAHMAVPELDDSGVPATVSAKVLTDLLRNELHFSNLIVTDAMTMQGLTDMFNNGEAAVRSILAGADVLLMPPDPDQAIRAVVVAVEQGRIPRQRINESALRVLTAKVALGLTRRKLVDLDTVADTLASPEAFARAQQISDKAVTLLRNEGGVLPLSPTGQPCLVRINSLRTSVQGERLVREFRKRATTGRDFTVDTSMPLTAVEAVLASSQSCSVIVAASFASMTARTESIDHVITRLTQGTVPVVIATFNDPYIGGQFPKAAAYLTPFSSAPPAEVAVAKALFGEIPITGRTPVTIPDVAILGAGIAVPIKATTAVARRTPEY